MSKRARFHAPAASLLRARAAVIAVGIAGSAALGVGAAAAADTGSAATPDHVAAAPAASHHTQSTDFDGQLAAKAKKTDGWVKPVDHYKLSAAFDQAGSRWAHKHSGQDFAIPVGTSVKAAHDGVVVKAGGNGAGDGPAYGNAVVIKHSNGLYSQYAHLSRVDVHVGQSVKAGEHIAKSGNTGNTTGPHLHFEIRTTPDYGSAVNPVTFLSEHGLKL
ncbi:M23 family metallopeptidase [Streptomyces sp. NPDC050560]|uniref:M23 family metallopeptidase n=1 Tax=Streptomyces sp. NPDC050560 TaxID=3365630 RepID=UPI00379D52F6